MENDVRFVELVMKELTTKPEQVRVERSVDDLGVLLTLYVDPSDYGVVIGQKGNTIKAVRTLLRVVGAKEKARVNLKLFMEEKYRKTNREPSGAPHETSDILGV